MNQKMKKNAANQTNKLGYKFLSFLGLFVLLGVFFSCSVQKNSKTEEKSKGFISQDKLGNVYQVSDMRIIKYSNKLDSLNSNSIFSKGTIYSLDTRNPLQIMLFYKQQQQIVLLDNTLSETNKITLASFDWIDLVCMSNRDNAFWLYAITSQELLKTDKNGMVINRFNNIAQLVQKNINPTQLIEYENSVYLFDPNQGLFVFDLYGNYIKRVQLENAEIVKFYDKKVFFRVKNNIFSYNLVNFDKKLELESEGSFDDFEVGKSGVLVLEKSEINKR